MFTRILVPLDQSSLAEQALGTAAGIARAASASIELVLVHQALPYDGYTDAPWNAARRGREYDYLRGIADELESGARVRVSCSVLAGAPAYAIRARAAEIRAELIVMTTHGRTGLNRAWMGSIADAVVRSASVPVLLLHPSKHTALPRVAASFKKLIVPLDGSSACLEILKPAIDLARYDNAGIVLLRIVSPVPFPMVDQSMPFGVGPMVADPEQTEKLVREVEREVAELAKHVRGEDVRSVETRVVVSEHVAAAILEQSLVDGADLIAMTTHGRGATRLVIGSVADKVLRGTPLPLLLLRPSTVPVHDAAHAGELAEAPAPATP